MEEIKGFETEWEIDREEGVFKMDEFEGYGDERDDDVQDPPDYEQLREWVFDSVCEATDGCTVEPDGECPHGHISWLRAVGLV